MTIFLIIIAVVFAVIVTAIMLPVRCRFEVEGGTDSGLAFSGEIKPWSGFLGFGVSGDKGRYRARLFLLSRAVADFDITRYVRGKSTSKKASKSGSAVSAEGEQKGETGDRIDKVKRGIEKLREYRGYFREATRILRDIVRFDFVTANVTLGLANPAMTGMITGILFAVNDLMPREYTIKPSFDFTREVFDGDVWVELTVFPVMAWKHLFAHTADLIRFARSRRTRDTEILTQEV